MYILITGAKGFIGKNLVKALENIRDNKDRREEFASLRPLTISACDIDTTDEELDQFASKADLVVHLAGINRPKNDEEFFEGNRDFTKHLLKLLEAHNNKAPVLLSSSIQATLEGPYENSLYGDSKLQSELFLLEEGKQTGRSVVIYRFPNVFGKWCRPNYNSAVATFCHNISHGLPVTISDENHELNLIYIDDIVLDILGLLRVFAQKGALDSGYREIKPVYKATLGEIVRLLYEFQVSRKSLQIPRIKDNSFEKKLLSTYESYLAPDDFVYDLKENKDDRGNFAEFIKTPDRGQVSLNVVKPLNTKGNHWHQSKWEKFVVLSGEAIIKQRKVGLDENGEPYPVKEYHLSDERYQVVETPPGYTHSLHNPSNEDTAVCAIWCNEIFDPQNPDTYFEEV